jgi:hypothetical protein
MNIKFKSLVLSTLSIIALSSISEAKFTDSIDTIYVKMPSSKAKLWEAQSFPALPRKSQLSISQPLKGDVNCLESKGSAILTTRSKEERIENSHGLNLSVSQEDTLRSYIGHGSSYKGPLNVKQRQVEFVLAAVEALPNIEISSIFNVLKRPDINEHPVYSKEAIDDLLTIAMHTKLVQKMKEATGHPWRQRMPLPAIMRPDLATKYSLSSSIGLPVLKKNEELAAVDPLQESIGIKSVKQETPPLSEGEGELGFFAKQKNRVFSAVKSLTSWFKFY